MKKITEEEYDEAKGRLVQSVLAPLIVDVKNMFKEDKSLNYVEIEREDLPEDLQYRFDDAPELQKLAGVFRTRISPLDDLRVSVRNGRLFICRGRRPKPAAKLR